jgi:hypothetical protein
MHSVKYLRSHFTRTRDLVNYVLGVLTAESTSKIYPTAYPLVMHMVTSDDFSPAVLRSIKYRAKNHFIASIVIRFTTLTALGRRRRAFTMASLFKF